jgi:putative SOS response-associated peptidase YedK
MPGRRADSIDFPPSGRGDLKEPNELCAELHNQMPVILGREVWPEWLGEEPVDPARLKTLLCPYPAEKTACWPVSTRVGNVKNNDASLIEPVALAG